MKKNSIKIEIKEGLLKFLDNKEVNRKIDLNTDMKSSVLEYSLYHLYSGIQAIE